jgi:RNA polymerase sigma factor (TIGR02999 family)
VSEFATNWTAGNPEAFRSLIPLFYDDLRWIAHQQLRKAHSDHTLQPSDLVHEAYLRLETNPQSGFQNRAHFLAVCALLMHQIISRHGRTRRAAKRGGGSPVATLNHASEVIKQRPIDLLALDDALDGLAQLDLRQSRIVELRFFGGLSIEETAAVMGVAPATVKRHWALARLWLHKEICRAGRA